MKSIYSNSIPRFDKPSPQFKKHIQIDRRPYIEVFDPINLRKINGYDLPKFNPSDETEVTNQEDAVKIKIKRNQND